MPEVEDFPTEKPPKTIEDSLTNEEPENEKDSDSTVIDEPENS